MPDKEKCPETDQHVLPQREWSNRFKLLFGAVILSFVAWYYSSSRNNVPHSSSDLPKTYALCSAEGERAIYTVDEDNRKAECILVDGDYVAGSGSPEELQSRYTSDKSHIIGLNSALTVVGIAPGAIVIPGITDSHCHILEYGASRQIPLSEGRTVQETVSFIAEYITSHPDIERDRSHIIEGWGWDHEGWDVAKMPTAADLEANSIVRGRLVRVSSKDGHAIWASKATLEANAPYPETIEGGVIVRDENGEPSGVFIDTAQGLIASAPVSEDDQKRQFAITVKEALKHGLTSLHDAGFSPDSLTFFSKESKRDGGLPIRIYGMTYFDEHGSYWGDQLKPLSGASGTERLSARSVKIFADGALRTGGAALYEPYADNPSTSGQLRLSADVLKSVIPRYMKDGWQVNVHAIGDRANGIVLDAFEAALSDMNLKNATGLRPRLEHAQLMTQDDIKRVGRLGVIASVQPTHAHGPPNVNYPVFRISDMWFGEERLGPERVKGLYAFRSLLTGGARITLGSDFPVESINPLAGFYAAITRVSFDGTSPHGPGGWFPEQRLNRLEALRGMTVDPAYASFTEDTLGSLVSGKKADYVVLSRDIMTVPVDQIMDTQVLVTALDGRIVYGNF